MGFVGDKGVDIDKERYNVRQRRKQSIAAFCTTSRTSPRPLNTHSPAVRKAQTNLGLKSVDFTVQYNFAGCNMFKYDEGHLSPKRPDQRVVKGRCVRWSHHRQLVMGYVGDWIGRNRIESDSGFGRLWRAFVCRLFVGDRAIVYAVMAVSRSFSELGLAGCTLFRYKAAEESATNDMQAAIYVCQKCFWQMPGAVFPYIIALLLLVAVLSAQIQFRILLALGAIPSFFIYRATASEEDSSEFRRDGPRVSAWELA